jgi:hypothetical protein
MSTRSQVKVIGTIGDGSQMLYHHTDGYPDYMIPLLKSAAKLALDNSSMVKYAHEDAAKFSVSALPWEAGRVGKVASALCASDPLIMEPDASELHGDIAYLYRLYLVNPSGMGHCGERVRWDIEILTPNTGFWDNSTEENMTVTLARKPLHRVTKKDIKIASQR